MTEYRQRSNSRVINATDFAISREHCSRDYRHLQGETYRQKNGGQINNTNLDDQTY